MVHLRFTSFVLVLLFVMPVLSESSAYAQQGEDQGYFAAKENNVAVPKGVLPHDGVNAADGLGKIWHGGRKLMAVQKVLLSEEIEREDHGLNGRTSEISGATHSDGILDIEVLKGADFKVKCKLWGKSDIAPKKHKASGFVAFTADYHGPKRHPPKHN